MVSFSNLLYFFIAAFVILSGLYSYLILYVEAKRLTGLSKLPQKEDYSSTSISTFSSPNMSNYIFAINFEEASNAGVEDDDFKIQLYNMKQYFGAVYDAITKAEESIYLVDYVEHGKEMDKSSEFSNELRKVYELYFQSLEDLLKNKPSITYVRILQAPLNSDMNGKNRPDIIKYVLDRLYSPTRKHIDSIIHLDNFKLYIIPNAIRSISEIIIDDKEWFIEIDRYDLNGAGRPDRLFANTRDLNNEKDRVGYLINDEIRIIKLVISNDDNKPVTREELANFVKDRQEALAEKKRAIEEENQDLTEDFVNSSNIS